MPGDGQKRETSNMKCRGGPMCPPGSYQYPTDECPTDEVFGYWKLGIENWILKISQILNSPKGNHRSARGAALGLDIVPFQGTLIDTR